MAQSENKTSASTNDVGAFLAGVADERSRADAHLLVELMHEATGEPAVMWGTSESVRLEPALRTEAAQRGATDGVTVSEVMRRVLREYLRSA